MVMSVNDVQYANALREQYAGFVEQQNQQGSEFTAHLVLPGDDVGAEDAAIGARDQDVAGDGESPAHLGEKIPEAARKHYRWLCVCRYAGIYPREQRILQKDAGIYRRGTLTPDLHRSHPGKMARLRTGNCDHPSAFAGLFRGV